MCACKYSQFLHRNVDSLLLHKYMPTAFAGIPVTSCCGLFLSGNYVSHSCLLTNSLPIRNGKENKWEKSKTHGLKYKQFNNGNKGKYNNKESSSNSNCNEGQSENPRRASDTHYSCSPPTDQCPTCPQAAPRQLPPVYILGMAFCGMEYPFGQFRSAVLAMFSPPQTPVHFLTGRA